MWKPHDEKFFLPKRKFWGQWVDVVVCYKCGQVKIICTFQEGNDGQTVVPVHGDESWEKTCKRCGASARNVKSPSSAKFPHCISGVAVFTADTVPVWWNPWSKLTGHWTLHPSTLEDLGEMTALDMLGSVPLDDEEDE